jgi:hypothetical protein
MKPFAYKTVTAAYADIHTENSNPYSDIQQRLNADFIHERISKRKIISRKGNNPLGAADSILRIFSGTIVTDYIPGIEWGAQCHDMISGNL